MEGWIEKRGWVKHLDPDPQQNIKSVGKKQKDNQNAYFTLLNTTNWMVSGNWVALKNNHTQGVHSCTFRKKSKKKSS